MLSWAKFPQDAFHDIAGRFHLQDMLESSLQHFIWTSSLWNQHHFPTTAISDMVALVGLPPLPQKCMPQLPAPCSSEHLQLQSSPMGKQRQQRGQFSVPDASSKPQTGLWKGFLLHWGHLLVRGWGGSLCSGRAHLGQAPRGKHPSKVHPQPASALPPSGPWSL